MQIEDFFLLKHSVVVHVTFGISFLWTSLRFMPILAGRFGILNKVGIAVIFKVFLDSVMNISFSKWAAYPHVRIQIISIFLN